VKETRKCRTSGSKGKQPSYFSPGEQ